MNNYIFILIERHYFIKSLVFYTENLNFAFLLYLEALNMHKTKIGLGLAAIGRPDYINIRQETDIDKSFEAFEQNAFSMLDFAYLHGIRHFDTAASYGKGEQFLIDWNNKNTFTDLELSTKWGYTYVANWEIGYTGDHEIKEHSIAKLKEQWLFSKALLPALKTYQIHSATLESGVLSNKALLNELYHIKQVTGLKIGLSTSGANQKDILELALSIEIEGEALFDSFQVTYNVLEQSCFEVLKKVIGLGKQVIIKEAMANGRLFLNENLHPKTQKLLASLAKKHLVGIDAVALRFVMDAITPTVVLSGASTLQQLSENLLANSFSLAEEDISALYQSALTPLEYWTERKALEWN